MNWALVADGMTYVPKHRANRPVDACSFSGLGPRCEACATYPGQHRADVPAVTR